MAKKATRKATASKKASRSKTSKKTRGTRAGARSEPRDESVDQALSAMYEHNADNWQFFLDYRHKFLIRFFVAVAATFAFVRWLWDLDPPIGGGRVVFVPILVLSVLSFVFLRIEERTAKVLRASHFVGDRIEKIWARRARTALAPTRRRPSKDAEQRNLDEGWSEFGEAEREAGDDPDARDPIGFFSALACEFDPSRTHARILVKLYLFTGVTAGVGALCACIGLTFGATAELTTAAAIVLAVILLVIDVLLCWLAWRFWTGKRGMEGGDPA